MPKGKATRQIGQWVLIGLGITRWRHRRNLVERGWAVVGSETPNAARQEAEPKARWRDDRRSRRAPSLLRSIDDHDEPAQRRCRPHAVATEIAGVASLRVLSSSSAFTIADGCVSRPFSSLQVILRSTVRSAEPAPRPRFETWSSSASGDETAIVQCTDLFADFAKQSADLGDYGNGGRMKFVVANHLVAIHSTWLRRKRCCWLNGPDSI